MKKAVYLALLFVGVVSFGFFFSRGFLAKATPGTGSSRNGDVNCDGQLDISDAVYTLQYLFMGGPAPCAFASGGSRSIWVTGDAFALSGDPRVTHWAGGLLWQPGFVSAASLTVAVPPDWDGVSQFTVDIYFNLVGGMLGTGVVDFFTRPVGRHLGELMADPGSVTSTPVPVTPADVDKLLRQRFVVPSSRLPADSEVLHLYLIQRGGPGETYSQPVSVLGTKITYTAK